MFRQIGGATLWAAGLLAPASVAAASNGSVPVQVGFDVSPITEADRQPRAVGPGEPIFVQRMTAIKSATLQAEGPDLPAGTRLMLATSPEGGEFYCGAPTPSVTARIMVGARTPQWVCLQDGNADGVFESAWSTPANLGARVPSFRTLYAPAPVSLRYTVDPDDKRDFYETTVMHEKSFNLYGRMFFYIKVRRQGETEWLNLASTSSGIRGGYETVAARSLPATLHIGGAKLRILTAENGKTTVQVEAAPSGYVAYGTRPGL